MTGNERWKLTSGHLKDFRPRMKSKSKGRFAGTVGFYPHSPVETPSTDDTRPPDDMDRFQAVYACLGLKVIHDRHNWTLGPAYSLEVDDMWGDEEEIIRVLDVIDNLEEVQATVGDHIDENLW